MKNFFKKLFQGLKSLFTRDGLRRIDAVLSDVEAILPLAFEIVGMLAKLTPTRSDDELIAAARSLTQGEFQVSGLLLSHSREDVLRAIAMFTLRKAVRNEVRDKVLALAVEGGVALLEGAQQK